MILQGKIDLIFPHSFSDGLEANMFVFGNYTSFAGRKIAKNKSLLITKSVPIYL